jgi:hypothetical protein
MREPARSRRRPAEAVITVSRRGFKVVPGTSLSALDPIAKAKIEE